MAYLSYQIYYQNSFKIYFNSKIPAFLLARHNFSPAHERSLNRVVMNPASPRHRNPNPFTFYGLTPAAAAVCSSASAPSLPPSSDSRDRPRRSAAVLAQAASPRGRALLLQVQAHVPPSPSSHLIFLCSHGGAALQAR